MIEKMAKEQREIANGLFSTTEWPCCGEERCLEAEESRPLTKDEKKQGWTMRPFYAYDPRKMCDACAAYFYAEMAAQLLHKQHCREIRCAAKALVQGAAKVLLADA